MRSLNTWLSDYSNDHRNRTNQKFHLICVPLIFLCVAGGLHRLPYYIGDVALLAALVWYAALGFKAFAIMALQLFVGLVIASFLSAWALVAIFVVAWIGQFYGHHLEGRRPSFLKDLQYLLIGPLWVWLGH